MVSKLRGHRRFLIADHRRGLVVSPACMAGREYGYLCLALSGHFFSPVCRKLMFELPLRSLRSNEKELYDFDLYTGQTRWIMICSVHIIVASQNTVRTQHTVERHKPSYLRALHQSSTMDLMLAAVTLHSCLAARMVRPDQPVLVRKLWAYHA